jgi:hypothetical protein
MKASLVITNDVRQVILSPENETEKKILSAIKGTEKADVDIHVGSFWDGSMYGHSYKSSRLQACQGGWTREYSDADSVILVIKDAEKVDEVLE